MGESHHLENPSGDYDSGDNRELSEEEQDDNDIDGNQLGGPQYKLNQGDGRFSRDRSLGNSSQEIPGTERNQESRNVYLLRRRCKDRRNRCIMRSRNVY